MRVQCKGRGDEASWLHLGMLAIYILVVGAIVAENGAYPLL